MNLSACARIAVIVLFGFVGIVSAEPSLTIYNQNFAVVRQPLALDLKAGVNEVRVTDITAHMEPDSVILRDPQGKRAVRILEQNYRADPISQGLLLSLYEGKEIDFLVQRGEGKEEIIRGRIIRSGYQPHQSGLQRYGYQYAQQQMARASYEAGGQPIIEVNGKLRFSLPGLPLFPSLADDTILKPTVHWMLQADRAGKLEAELSYVTGGMSWEADYSMVAPSAGETIDVIGWVTMDNQSGKTFENARIKLMAGDVSKIRPEIMGMMAYDYEARAAGAPMEAPVSEKAFEEYHLYTLSRPATLHDRETKQVEFLRAEGVQAQRIYVYDGVKIDRRRYPVYSEGLRNDRNYGTQSNPKVWVMREIQNSKENHLGIPLPKGRMRFYQRDDDGQLEFIGENTIDHTPRDETVRVYTGDAFDLVGERRRTDYRIDTERNWLDESFEIKVRNRKEQGPVEIRVVEHLYRWPTWEIVEKSDPFTKTDSQTIEFRVQVPTGQEKVVTYKVHYTW
ncbi:MAG: hypothetical protein A2Y76_04005 [Planctomycetes bacterium RBG_13_60_9]|nr:MAG: hypothetical protein A2Y76_04005 [Planctomycetes bacterium RBG_13_60_9]